MQAKSLYKKDFKIRLYLLLLFISCKSLNASPITYNHTDYVNRLVNTSNQKPNHIYFKQLGVDKGISNPSIMSIYQDQLGRMWFGTREGINIYNGEQTIVYKGSGKELQNNLLNGNECDQITGNQKGDVFFRSGRYCIQYDIREERFKIAKTGNIRVVTEVNGDIWCISNDSIYIHDSQTDSLSFYRKIGLNKITTLHASGEKLWIGTSEGLYLQDGENTPQKLIEQADIYSIFETSTHEIWVGSRMDGLFRFLPNGETIHHTGLPSDFHPIASSQIREFVEDSKGNIWFGTFKGIHCYNPQTNQFSVYQRDLLPGSLTHSSVFSLHIDKQGTIWIGTYYGGVNYFNPGSDIFSHYIDNPGRDDCLSYPFVGHMVEDKNENIWICTEGGGLNFFDRKTQKFRYFMEGGSNSIAHNNLKSICYDSKHDYLYIGTHIGGVSRYDIKNNRFYNFWDHDKNEASSPNQYIIQTTFHNDTLYVAARNGVFYLSPDSKQFVRFFPFCHSFTFDQKGNCWFASSHTLIRKHLTNPQNEKHFSLEKYDIHFPISCLIEKEGDIYFGTSGAGLYKFNEETNTVVPYTASNGYLLSDYCYSIAEAQSGNLIITTDEGITFLNTTTSETRFIKLSTSLPLTSLTEGCGILVCKNGEVIIGGTDGMISFQEKDLNSQEKEYQIYFTDLHIGNKKVTPGDQTKVLKNALSFTNSIRLKHNQNNLIIDFASSNYIGIQKNNQYEYKLKGFDQKWVPTSLSSIYYTNLNPGKYQLLVREANIKTRPPHEISLQIQIDQPWYNTVWAWLVYIAITTTLIWFFIRTKKARRELALSLEKERKEKEWNEEINQAKFRFFTNISHEFRTPLTLIISQIDILLQSNALSPFLYNKMLRISKNANRLKSMINELLEFRKLEQHHVTLRVSEQNVVSFLKEIFLSFHDLAIQRTISYSFSTEKENIPLWFDAFQLQKVFYNILSNAFKYTSEGKIVLHIEEEEDAVTIQIIDTGIGISTEDLSKIFDRFYQTKNEDQNSPHTLGTGIGLALSKNITELHHGEINVKSKQGKSTTFVVRLQKGDSHFKQDGNTIFIEKAEETISDSEAAPDKITDKEYENIRNSFPEQKDNHQYTILLIEDNEELLQILNTLFSPLYRTLLAHNGQEGYQLALDQKPDLIVSDVMMPVMSGTEMCIKIKNNIDLCHIPVVLLTALNSAEQTIEGLQNGADDYIVKPFHTKMLLMRCNNLIRNRVLLQNKFSKQTDFDIQLLAVNPLDKKLLNKITVTIENNLENTSFDINSLAKELAMSRSSFFSKFKALTGMTPNEYIQSERLKKAASLLREYPDKQINEISDMLNFSSTIYFSRCFKAHFGVSPSQFRQTGIKD